MTYFTFRGDCNEEGGGGGARGKRVFFTHIVFLLDFSCIVVARKINYDQIRFGAGFDMFELRYCPAHMNLGESSFR